MLMCEECGHARMAHLGGSCTYSGCTGKTFRVETGVLAPGSGRPQSRRPPQKGSTSKRPRATRVATPVAEPLSGEQRDLVDFVCSELSPEELRRFCAAVAEHHGLVFDRADPCVAAKALIKALGPDEAGRYLAALRRRQAAGEQLVRQPSRRRREW